MTSHTGATVRRTFGRRFAGPALLAGCAILIAGCATNGRHDPMISAPNDYRLRHPITVKEKDHTVEVFVGSRNGGLSPDQRSNVMAFAQSWRREATGGIVVEIPADAPNTAASTGALRDVGAIFTAAGIPPEAVGTRYYRPRSAQHLAPVRLNYPVMAAEAGPCGLWPNDIGPTAPNYKLNRSYWNLGCASQRNLAAMVANPADLVQPRGETPVYAARRATVLDKYRKGEQTSSTAPSNDAAKISDVGK
jgi:pilus assembly protein CpaD